MKNTVILLLISLVFLTECQRTKLSKTHGISYLDKREKLIIVNKSNKNDAIKVLGQPATKGMTDDNLWIYIERTITRGKTLKLGGSELTKNNVLVLEFDKYGVLNNKTFYDKKNIKDIKFAKAITVNDIKRENFVYSFLASIRQKMQQGKK
jgi:outer membrane protein assembly factor BamE (lipoprotein component of BamABCDE complex)